MVLLFQILAVLFAAAAGFFLWQDNIDRMFAAAVLGAVSFFLSVRFQVKARINARALEKPPLDEAGT